MQTAPLGNERFYLAIVDEESLVKQTHAALFSQHAEAYNQFFDLVSEFDEPYVRENYRDLTRSVDLIAESAAKVHDMQANSSARRDGLILSLVKEIQDIASKPRVSNDAMVCLRADLNALSTFRFERVDGIRTDFWFMNATGQVTMMDKAGISRPIMSAWCKAHNLKLNTIDSALTSISALWDRHASQPERVVASLAAGLDTYPFDVDQLLEASALWPEHSPEILDGIIAFRRQSQPMLSG